MNKIYRNLFRLQPLWLGILLCFTKPSYAQISDSIKSKFQQYNNRILHEKIFVHTDKNFYLAGEILWFKIYNTDANDHKLLNLSKIAYIELLDNNNLPVIQTKTELKNGLGNGSVYIPVTINNGNYKLRCYTSWMKNFDPDFYFEQNITVVNTLKTPESIPTSKPVNNTDIQFFPEGGNLIEGINNVVAFKTVNSNGSAVDVTGVVINERNDTVAKLQSLKFGMGKFNFIPAGGNTYKAVLRGVNNKNVLIIKELPNAVKQGYALVLNDGNNSTLTLKIATAGVPSSKVYLIAHSGNNVTIAQEALLANNQAIFSVDKNKLGAGISHFTVFNNLMQPVCERLYFKRSQPLAIETTLLPQYGLRDRVEIGITTNTPDGHPQATNMSLCIYRVDSLTNNTPVDIFNYLMLTSELKGKIEKPDFYFNSVNEGTDAALDNLILTHGWSRYTWQDVLNPPKLLSFKYLPEIEGHIITAKLTNSVTNKPADGIVSYLAVTGKRLQLYPAAAAADGQLLFNTKNFYGANELVLQTNFSQDSTYHIEINSPFSNRFSATQVPVFMLDKNIKKYLEISSLGMQVQNIYSGIKMKQFYKPLVDSSAFYGNIYKNYFLDDFTRFTTMEEVMREYVAEVNVVRRQKKFHIKVLNENGFLDNDPLVILDGIPVFDVDKIFKIDPLKIKSLQDVNIPYYLGPVVTDGVFNFTSYKGDLAGLELDPRAVVLDYEGMQLQREFYSPVYDTDDSRKGRVPDFRSLLYWAPNVNTGQQGKAAVSFYTSDQPGMYIGILQGITGNGDAGSKYFRFNVHK